MMGRFRQFGLLVGSLMALAACDSTTVNTPHSDQPKLTNVVLNGHRVCGTFDTTDFQHNFSCAPLPTIAASGWQLTPLERIDIPPINTKHGWNGTATIHVTTPSVTSLEVAYRPTNTARWVLPQIKPPTDGNRQAPVLQSQGWVWVDATDNGTVKDWAITLRITPCQEQSLLEIVNIDSQGNRSSALSVTLLRAPKETYCGGASTGVGSSDGGGLITVKTSPGSMTPVPAPGSCTPRVFTFCERCAPGLAETRSYSACTERQAKIDLGYIDPVSGQSIHTGLLCHPTSGACP